MNEFVSNYFDGIILRSLHKFINFNCGEILEVIIGKVYIYHRDYEDMYVYLARPLSVLYYCISKPLCASPSNTDSTIFVSLRSGNVKTTSFVTVKSRSRKHRSA